MHVREEDEERGVDKEESEENVVVCRRLQYVVRFEQSDLNAEKRVEESNLAFLFNAASQTIGKTPKTPEK